MGIIMAEKSVFELRNEIGALNSGLESRAKAAAILHKSIGSKTERLKSIENLIFESEKCRRVLVEAIERHSRKSYDSLIEFSLCVGE